MGRVSAAERGARAAWTRLAEPADERALRLIAQHGAVDALALAVCGDSRVHETFRARAQRYALGGEPHAYLEQARLVSATLVCPGDDTWPEGLDVHPLPPICLWVKGDADLATLAVRSVSVVGARTSTSYGDTVATGFGAGLAERGWVVVSGAAFGIDAAAHRGALAVEGRTVAVLAGGVDRPYPSAHAALIDEIVRTGAVVSEAPPGAAPTRPRFLLRNRLIATVSRGTVVIEAGLRSGSLNTARTAAECGRPVGVVPGPVTSMMSAGCHQARRDGLAEIVTDVDEVLDLVGDIGGDAADRKTAPRQPVDGLDPQDALVLSAVPVRRAVPADAVAIAAGVGTGPALASLGRLQLAGFVERRGADWKKVAMASAR